MLAHVIHKNTTHNKSTQPEEGIITDIALFLWRSKSLKYSAEIRKDHLEGKANSKLFLCVLAHKIAEMPPKYSRRENLSSADEENAAELKLGAEFQNELCLAVDEVKILLERAKEEAQAQTGPVRRTFGTNFHKAFTYVENRSKFEDTESIQEMRRILRDESGLELFEQAQIANLLPDRAEEAKALIPSIGSRIDDDRLQALLDSLHNLKEFSLQ